MKTIPIVLLFTVALVSAELDSLCKKSTGNYQVANPSNCSSFIRCSGHSGTKLSCPDGKLFDVKLLICRPAANAICAADVIPDYVLDICKGMKNKQLVPGIECSKYYECNGTDATAHICPNGQHYSRAYGTCMNPLLAGCRALGEMCINEYSGFGFPSLKCEGYYVCNQTLSPQLKSCNEGLYFSPDQQKCMLPALSGCSNDGSITTEGPDGGCVDPPVPACNSANSGEFFPHPNPAWFFMCYNKEALELQCETGLNYDTRRKYCVKDAYRACL